MSGYVLSLEAQLDMEEIWDYIAEDSTGAADRWIETHLRCIQRIGADAANRTHA